MMPLQWMSYTLSRVAGKPDIQRENTRLLQDDQTTP
jgi:hypothetical protein